MSESFPSREVIRLIEGQARVEQKLDGFLKTQEARDQDLQARVTAIDSRVKKIEDKATKQGGYIAGITAVVSSALIFFIPWAKQKLGL